VSGITITELARRLDLGKSTVQRALSGTGKVDPETRRRILEEAERAGYQRNLYFAALSSQRRQSRDGKLLVHYVSQDIPRAEPHSKGKQESTYLHEIAGEFGMAVEAVDPACENARRLARILWHQGSAGLLLGNCGEEFLSGLDDSLQVPVLNLLSTEHLPYHAIGFDMTAAVRLCWERLMEAGYRRIGCAVMRHDPPNRDDSLRLGAALTLAADHLPPEERIPPLTSPIQESGAFTAWLRHHQPEAVIGFSPGFHWECHDAAGRPIPFVTLHASERSDNRHIPGSLQDWRVHARNAMRQMDVMIRCGDCGIPAHRSTLLIDPRWHAGEGIPIRKV